MHKQLPSLLQSAKGESRHVVVVFLDVRGFSSFAKIAESSDAAEFLRSAYLTMIDAYFKDADFFKLTGDGMLALFGYERETLDDTVRKAVGLSIALAERFPTICDEDPMINFDVPPGLGIGLARGAATALISGETVLDYSGRPLNLAARLMDLARPSGVVLDDSLGFGLLEEGMRERFASESVYIKGIAEDDPIPVYYLAEYTEIPEYNKLPMNRVRRVNNSTRVVTLRALTEMGNFRERLQQTPARTDDLVVLVSAPKARANGTKHPSIYATRTWPAEYVVTGGEDFARIDYGVVAQALKGRGVKSTWPVELTVEYSVRGEARGDDAPTEVDAES